MSKEQNDQDNNPTVKKAEKYRRRYEVYKKTKQELRKGFKEKDPYKKLAYAEADYKKKKYKRKLGRITRTNKEK